MDKLEERTLIYSVVAIFCAGIAGVTDLATGAITLAQITVVIETVYWLYNPLIRHIS